MSDKFLIDDLNSWKFTDPDPKIHGRGLVPRDYAAQPYGSVPGVAAYAGPIKTKAECIEIAKERIANKSTNRDIADLFGIPIYDQNGTNFCWMNAVIKAMLYTMAKSGQPVVQLSAASVACLITNFQNRGGWGGDAIEGLKTKGGVPVEFWPNNAINRKYDTPENNARRLPFHAIECMELERYNLDQLRSVLTDGWTVPAGLDWWGHEILITDYDPTDVYDFDNSWGTRWGDRGRGSLSPKKAQGDYVAIRTITAT